MKSFKDHFKETILQEYSHADPSMLANSVSAKKHGKSIMRTGRKHENLLRKEYQSKNSIVNGVMKTKTERILKGAPLTNLLKDYDMKFSKGLKGLGNGVKIYMYIDNKDEQVGVVCHRDKCSKYENS